MQQRKDLDTPVTKAGEESINTGDELNEDEARRARRAIARKNYMSQDRPDLSVVARCPSTCPGVERGCCNRSAAVSFFFKREIIFVDVCGKSHGSEECWSGQCMSCTAPRMLNLRYSAPSRGLR